MTKALSSLGEFGWLKRLLPKLYWPSGRYSQLLIGPGDDAGVVRISRRKVLVATTDAMVEGVHFQREWMSWRDLGEKVLAVNLSDLAAMGRVTPVAALVTAGFPGDTPVESVEKFYEGLENCAQRWKTGFLGGDTVGSPGPWFVSVTLFGEADPRQLLKRSGARPGDWIATTGPLGLAGAGLEVLQKRKSRLQWTAPLVRAFLHPQPRFAAGAALAKGRLATSLMDCSDGLEASVRLLAEASLVGAVIDLGALPMPKALTAWATLQNKDPRAYALRGGEDYELIFTVPPARWDKVRQSIPQAVRIGQVLPKRAGVWAVDAGRRQPLKGYGFAHFK